MSLQCDNTTPLGSKSSPEALNENSAALLEAMLDLTNVGLAGELTDANGTTTDEFANPLVTLDRNDLAETALLLNNLLANIPLDEFPNLKDKMESDGSMTVSDLAELAIDQGVDIADIKKDLSDFNEGLPPSSTNTSLTEAGTRVVTDATGSTLVDDTTASRLNSNELTGAGSGDNETGVITDTDSSGYTTGTSVGLGTGATDDSGIDSTGQSTTAGGIIATGLGGNQVTTGTGTGATQGGVATVGFATDGSTTENGSTSSNATINTGSSESSILGANDTRLSQRVSTPLDSTTVLDSSNALPTSAIGASALGAAALAQSIPGVGGASGPNALDRLQRGINDIYGSVANFRSGLSTIVPLKIYELLNKLDFQALTNLGQKLSAGICGAYNDVLRQVDQFTQIVKTGKKTLSEVKNLFEKDLKKLTESVKQKGVLDTLMEIIAKIIEGVVKVAQGVVVAALGGIFAILKKTPSAAKSIMKKVTKTAQDAKNYMKDASVKKIVEDMEALVTKLAEQFERLTPQNIKNLMFRLCEMAKDLQGKLMQPAQNVNKFAQSLGSQSRAIASASAKNTQKAVKAGAIRISEADRKAKSKESTDAINAKASPKNSEASYVNDKEMTDQEMELLMNIDGTGIGGVVVFGENLQKEDALGKQLGWENVKTEVWQKLLRMCSQTGFTYTVMEGWVRPKYNKVLRSKTRTPHTTGYTIEILVSPAQRKETIVAASRAGFTSITVYPTHIRLSLSNRRSHLSSQFSGQEATELEEMLDKHNIDGFKIKRTQESDSLNNSPSPTDPEVARQTATEAFNDLDVDTEDLEPMSSDEFFRQFPNRSRSTTTLEQIEQDLGVNAPGLTEEQKAAQAYEAKLIRDEIDSTFEQRGLVRDSNGNWVKP